MEPVILIVAVTAILSGTYIRSKKISLEKERLRLGAGEPLPEKKKGLFSKAKSTPLITVNNTKSVEMEKLQKRLENLEVIMLDQAESNPNNTGDIIEELRKLSARIKQLEQK